MIITANHNTAVIAVITHAHHLGWNGCPFYVCAHVNEKYPAYRNWISTYPSSEMPKYAWRTWIEAEILWYVNTSSRFLKYLPCAQIHHQLKLRICWSVIKTKIAYDANVICMSDSSSITGDQTVICRRDRYNCSGRESLKPNCAHSSNSAGTEMRGLMAN